MKVAAFYSYNGNYALNKIKLFVRDKSYSATDIPNMFEFLPDNIFVIFGGRVFSTDSRHTYGYKLCSSSRRLVPLFV